MAVFSNPVSKVLWLSFFCIILMFFKFYEDGARRVLLYIEFLKNIKYRNLLQMITGFTLYFKASSLSKNFMSHCNSSSVSIRTVFLTSAVMILVFIILKINGFLLIFSSSYYPDITTSIIAILLLGGIIKSSWISYAKYIWSKFFPPKVKLLTELEYINQGKIETKKALDNLRNYCSSPECNIWQVILRLENPLKFANFIEGSVESDEESFELLMQIMQNSNDVLVDELEDELNDIERNDEYELKFI